MGRNRYSRYAYLRSLQFFQHHLGISPQARWVILRSGARICCDLQDNLQSELYFFGEYAETELNFLRSHLRPGEVFVDVGAHVGLFSIEIARHVGRAGIVDAFEPASDILPRLAQHLLVNGVSDTVRVHPFALGAEDGVATLRSLPGSPNDYGRRGLMPEGPRVEDVTVRSLDSLVEAGEVDFGAGPHAVKIDVEGSELKVLRGMYKLLERTRPRAILVETLPQNLRREKVETRDIYDFMETLDYEVVPGNAGDMLPHSYIVNTAFISRSAPRNTRR